MTSCVHNERPRSPAMSPRTWSTFFRRTCIVTGILLIAVVSAVGSSCPRDLSAKAHSCFTAYSFHFQNMQHSPDKLCCGVDVETLRAFCHSYMRAVTCVDHLKDTCPEERHHVIVKALVNLDGAQPGLQELCSDDSIIESYAMYQSCFRRVGYGSENCFRVHLNDSKHNNIRFLSKVNTKRKDQFCQDMRAVVGCVQKNVKGRCGEKASRLAAILVKPMVRQSTECDYSVITPKHKTTSRPSHGNPAYISDAHDGGKKVDPAGGNSGQFLSASAGITLFSLVCFALMTLRCAPPREMAV